MKTPVLYLAFSGLLIAGVARARTEEPMSGVSNPRQAHVDYMLKCQGCHRPDGSGDLISNPPMNGKVAKFLGVPGGRAFLAQVPGVSTVDLNDARLAELLNWTLYRFDRGNLPKNFKPYTAGEIAKLRKTPLRTEREDVRQALIAKMPGRTI